MQNPKKANRKPNRLNLIITVLAIAVAVLALRYYIYDKQFPLHYFEIIEKESRDNSVDPYMIAALIKAESGFMYNAVSSKDARGLMQLTPDTAQWCAGEISYDGAIDLFDPKVNIKLGTWYFAHHLNEKYNGEIDLMLAAYNAGPGNVDKWLQNEKYSQDGTAIENVPYKETKNFIKRVNLYYTIYKLIYGV